jgi:hypothetical protein
LAVWLVGALLGALAAATALRSRAHDTALAAPPSIPILRLALDVHMRQGLRSARADFDRDMARWRAPVTRRTGKSRRPGDASTALNAVLARSPAERPRGETITSGQAPSAEEARAARLYGPLLRDARLALDAATRVRRPIAEHNQLKAVFGLHAALALTGEQALDSGARVQGTEQIATAAALASEWMYRGRLVDALVGAAMLERSTAEIERRWDDLDPATLKRALGRIGPPNRRVAASLRLEALDTLLAASDGDYADGMRARFELFHGRSGAEVVSRVAADMRQIDAAFTPTSVSAARCERASADLVAAAAGANWDFVLPNLCNTLQAVRAREDRWESVERRAARL